LYTQVLVVANGLGRSVSGCRKMHHRERITRKGIAMWAAKRPSILTGDTPPSTIEVINEGGEDTIMALARVSERKWPQQ